MKKIFFTCLIFLNLICFSCNSPVQITGEWENEERILKFDDYGNFKIIYKNPKQVKSFNGRIERKKNYIILFFETYETTNGIIGYTEDTDLAGYKEVLEISVINDELYTKVLATKKEYKYSKCR